MHPESYPTSSAHRYKTTSSDCMPRNALKPDLQPSTLQRVQSFSTPRSSSSVFTQRDDMALGNARTVSVVAMGLGRSPDKIALSNATPELHRRRLDSSTSRSWQVGTVIPASSTRTRRGKRSVAAFKVFTSVVALSPARGRMSVDCQTPDSLRP
ncbi:hypothetical protein BDV98DRAFT_343700 [Pterulicium gracile]|uniref:Uncharacterized protein n=1 Tax=Pterulicium gracile TaxID=1884261 RepID=A0A5C3Q1R1_9AGAR|nr:hypothetical protein BDV98DRAFT_343700 [Pterula gracilis]